MRLFNRYCKCPVRFQRNKNESALVALQMILAYHNAFVPIETLRDNCCVERDGINDEGLIKIGDFYGLTGNAVIDDFGPNYTIIGVGRLA